VHPAVEAFRKYKRTELDYLTAIAEMRQAEHEPSSDLVAEMARVTEAEPGAGKQRTRGLTALPRMSEMGIVARSQPKGTRPRFESAV
jgi:hypothetical protein